MNVDQLVGSEVQGWLLTRIIGRGADGIVYTGQKDGIDAAVKIFFPDPVKKYGIASARERLELQLALIGKKHHLNLVEIYDGGEDTKLGTLFLVMELVAGSSLDKIVGNIPTSAIIPLAGQLASAAKHLEALELVHRDIKPANVVVSDDFQKITLLDLGILHQLPTDDDQGRLSGMEFISTLRYSPPEFVWRTEQDGADGAWRAVTLYQLGATLHDMVMGKQLFSGNDTPRARLYDSVRDRTPVVESTKIDAWLIQTIQACLLKDWRQRLQLVSWDSFFAPPDPMEIPQLERRIRLRQMRNEEIRQAAEKQVSKAPGPTREQQLWNLNNSLILEIRTYFLDTQIFPKCRVVESAISHREYVTELRFDPDPTRGFDKDVVFTISLSVADMLEEATRLSFTATASETVIVTASWTEMFTVDTAFVACRQSFLGAVESMLVM